MAIFTKMEMAYSRDCAYIRKTLCQEIVKEHLYERAND